MEPSRDAERRKFAKLVEGMSVKIQVGARGKKIAPDWIAIDKFDKSPQIDFNYDLHNLPYKDCTVDCYVCNAVLEHVFEPQLAIFEMYRTLKVGGLIWVEVPFNQFYHAHPYDFRRWTIQGIKWEMRRFQPCGVGVSAFIPREVKHVTRFLSKESKMAPPSEAQLDALEHALSVYTDTATLLRMYSSVYFWGRKASHLIEPCEQTYMARLREEVASADAS